MHFIIRFMGLIVLATGFIGIVIDGTRSMANTALLFSSLEEIGHFLIPNALNSFKAGVLSINPNWLWEVCHRLLQLPASVVCFAAGFLMLRIGHRKRPSDSAPGIPPLR